MEQTATSNGRPIFREVQRMQHAFLWVVAFLVAILMWKLVIQHRLFHWHSDVPMRTRLALALAWLAFGVAIPLFLVLCRIVTEVRPDGIYVQCIPFQRNFQRIPFTDFKRYEVRTCKMLYDFGGMGAQEGFKGRAYNIGGTSGIQFNMIDGRQILIGSRKSDEFLQVLHSQCRRPKRN